jgi:hypothetical protein
MPIDVVEARKRAAEAAEYPLRRFVTKPGVNLLRADYAEGESCWFFFRNLEIFVPPESMMVGGWAYAVSREGQVRQIADFSGDQEGLEAYLKTMSGFFQRNGG